MLFALAVALAASAPPTAYPGPPKGARVPAIHGTAPPLLQKAAPAANPHVTVAPLLDKAAPAPRNGAAGHRAVRSFTSAQCCKTNAHPNTPYGWVGIVGAIGLLGLWRRLR